jgi:serine phosphatase RsbU (regulator of sigma subunit)/anti-sigma regulatory factor (Ser/Thr protein kinase)
LAKNWHALRESGDGGPERAADGTEPDTEPPEPASRGQAACLELGDHPDSVRLGRRFVTAEAAARGLTGLVEDAALVVGELLANARQHGQPPVTVCVRGGDGSLRIEVTDGSPRSPIRSTSSLSNMTGRGLALVEAVTSRWGVDRAPGNGKTVWAQLEENAPTAEDPRQADALPAQWDDAPPTGEKRYTVVLGDVPTSLLIAAKAHIDNLVREFTLEKAAGGAIPDHYQRLIETVVHTFSDARHAIKRQALAAAARGEQRTRLILHLPASAAVAGETYLEALDEADSYSRAARLLTLETPPDHRLFRRWYVEGVVKQLRELAAGRTPPPLPAFEDRLVSEVRRLSPLQRSGARAARLLRVTAALAQTRTPEDVAAVVVSEGVEALRASGGSLLVPAEDGQHVAVPGAVGYEGVLVEAIREERIDAPLPAVTALRTGRAVWLESPEERDLEFPELRGFEAATVSMCAVPLVVAGRVHGALRFSFSAPKIFDDEERTFVLALAAQTAQTLQRAEAYQAERTAALDFQRALLPDDAPAVPGWTVATHYRPAGDQEAGGDFYDMLRLTDGRFAAIVGDVMGRGLEAAAAMAQIRSVVRAYAVEDPDPVKVFRRVDSFFEALAVPQLVTAVYFLVDPGSGTVRIVNAGHLPPILVDPNGSRALPTVTGPPFGLGSVDRGALTLRLATGAALIAVTDGLVERRGEDIDEGFDRILRATADPQEGDAEQLLKRVLSASVTQRATHDDDVTVLVIKRDQPAPTR